MNYHLIECKICDDTFQEPVTLPCCHNICKKHETVGKKISCPECNEIHEIPTNGFPPNLLARDLLNRKFDCLELGPEHNEAIRTYMQLKDLIDEFKLLRDNSGLAVTKAFDDIRNKVDLHREEAKKKIDDDALELIKELDEYESKCTAGLSSNNKLVVSTETEELVNTLEKDLSAWKEELEWFDRNFKQLRIVHQGSVVGYEKLRIEYDKITDNIFTEEFKKLDKKQKQFCGEMTDPLM